MCRIEYVGSNGAHLVKSVAVLALLMPQVRVSHGFSGFPPGSEPVGPLCFRIKKATGNFGSKTKTKQLPERTKLK